jgi:hypothetical protein
MLLGLCRAKSPDLLKRRASAPTLAGLTEKMFCSCDPGLGSAKTAEPAGLLSDVPWTERNRRLEVSDLELAAIVEGEKPPKHNKKQVRVILWFDLCRWFLL